MDVVNTHCAGLDVHKKTVVARVVTPKSKVTQTFGTTTKQLLSLSDWLQDHQVTIVAMESTGAYWKPIWNLLEGTECQLLLVNAHQVKQVPGRKTDVKDAEWIAELLRHGLLKGSYVPDRPQRELRELVRYRRTLIRERSRTISRVQKVLEGCNIKLSSVASDVVGVSGLAILKALVNGETDCSKLADLTKGRLKVSREELEEALEGCTQPHQRFLLGSLLRTLEHLTDEVEKLDEEVDERLSPFAELVDRLDEAPGVGRRSAQDVLAEIGTDMNRFPTAGHCVSWARICPGNNDSGGKRISGRIGPGNPWLRPALVEMAWSASNKKGSYYRGLYQRLKARRGGKRAIVAVARSLLETIYHMIKRGTTYVELGENWHDRINSERVVRRSVKRLEQLGYIVTVEKKVA